MADPQLKLKVTGEGVQETAAEVQSLGKETGQTAEEMGKLAPAAASAKNALDAMASTGQQDLDALASSAEQACETLQNTGKVATEAAKGAEELTQGAEEATKAVTSLGQASATAGQQVEQQATSSGKAAKANQQAAKGAEDSGKSSKQAAKDVNELGESFEKGAAAGRVVNEALHGNILALAQLAPAIKALGALIKTNLIGVLFTLGAIAAQFLIPMIKGFMDSKAAAEAAAKGFGKAKDSLDELVKKREWALAAQLDEIRQKTDALVTSMQALQAIEDAKTDTGEALALAQIRARTDLDAVQKLQEEQKIRAAGAAQRAKNAETYDYPTREKVAQAGVDSEKAKKAAAGFQVTSTQDQLDLANSIPTLKSGLDKLFDQYAQAGAALSAKKSLGPDALQTAEGQALQARYTALGQAIDDTRDRLKQAGKIDAEETQKKLDEAKNALAAASRSEAEALEKQKGVRTKIKSERAVAALKNQTQYKIDDIGVGLQARETYTSPYTPPGKPTAEEKAAYEAQIAKLTQQAEAAMLAGKFSGEGSQDEAVAAIAKTKKDWAAKYGTGDTPSPRAPAAPNPGYEMGPDGVMRRKGTTPAAKPGADLTYTPDGKASATPDLATPLTEAAAAHEESSKQSGESTKAAAEAAEKLKESAKPLDAAPLTSALQAAAAAQQTAGAQSAAAIQSLTSTAGQLTQIAQKQSRQIEQLSSQLTQIAQQVTNLRAAQNAA